MPADLDEMPDEASLATVEHDAERIHLGLERLTIEQRELMVLYFLEDLSTQEVALVLNIPLGTVKSRLHHARRALEQILTQMEARDER